MFGKIFDLKKCKPKLETLSFVIEINIFFQTTNIENILRKKSCC